jgi:predicted metalloprotease with PDZ domain
VVAAITPDSAAQRAGLAVGDVVLEVNGRLADADFEERLAELRPGEKLHLRVRNSDGEHELHWKLTSREQVELDLAEVDNVTAQQKARRAAWLKGESQISGEARP